MSMNLNIWTQPTRCGLKDNAMQVNSKEDCFTVSNGDFWVKTIHPHVVFTTNEHEAMLCLTKVEAEAIQEYISEHFSF